jgi:hypothetical protein
MERCAFPVCRSRVATSFGGVLAEFIVAAALGIPADGARQGLGGLTAPGQAGCGASFAGRAQVLTGQSGMAHRQDASMTIGATLSGSAGFRSREQSSRVVFMPLRPG